MLQYSITTNIPKRRGMLHAQVRQIARRVLKAVKKRTPRRSGRLRSGWKIRFEKAAGGSLRAILYNDVDYAVHVEYGTKHMKGYHMVRKTMGELRKGAYRW